ncbi:MAG: FAD-binding protein [Crocinitomicaceae bacterium]
MIKEVRLTVSPIQNADLSALKKKIKSDLSASERDKLDSIVLVKRSIDARGKQIKFNLVFHVYIDEQPEPLIPLPLNQVKDAPAVHIIGFGPGGMFAALQAIENGMRPIVFERGKEVRERRRDLVDIIRNGKVHSDSNYCFGEGGAGTYSDGKLYTRSKKRGDVKKVMEWFVQFGADPEILVDAHPHIGTNKLPKIIENIRSFILQQGGEIHFESRVTDILKKEGKIHAIVVDGKEINVQNLILATGHSARDVFEILHANNIAIEAKSFALGVRIEHQQELIDKIQYKGQLSGELLPPASYSLVSQVKGRGVFSFCMCPGGIIAPCATENGEVVTNGWSPSKRNNKFSNSGIVVQIFPEDFKGEDPFRCLNFQKEIEQKCFVAGGKDQKAPAQRMLDFINKKKSDDLPECSYSRGVVVADLNQIFPEFVSARLRQGLLDFGKKKKEYLTNDAILVAPESRTSSPIKIPRDRETYMHPDVKGLFPCAEGAGYAGGIVSAAVDGINCINAIK